MRYEKWASQFEDALREKGIGEAEIGRAREYWDEAYSDRCEAGMSDESAMEDLGSVDEAVSSVMESLPPFQRSLCGLRKNRERSVLVILLLVLGAIAWIPLVFALAMLAVAVYVLLWSLIVAAWMFEATGYVLGASSVVAFVLGAVSGNWVAAALDGGAALAVGGAAVFLTPLAIQVTSILFRTSIRFGHWIAHFFVRVARGDEAGPMVEELKGFWWARHADTSRTFFVVGGIILGAGVALVLAGLIACGFKPGDVAPLPRVNVGAHGSIGFPHITEVVSLAG